MKYFKRLSIIFILISLLAACSSSPNSNQLNEDQPDENTSVLKIYTTIYPLQYFAEKIGGNNVEISNIVPTGSDAHSFEPTTQTLIEISEGSAFIYMGTGIEGFVDAVVDSVKEENVTVAKAGEGIDLIDSIESEDDHEDESSGAEEHGGEGDKDPHVWLDPIRSIQLAENIKDTLIELKPEATNEFEENYSELKTNLENLDEMFTETVESSSRDSFIVSHAAYGYWAERYKLNQIGISGLSPTNEPSQKKLMEIIAIAKEEDITHILFEQNVNNRVAQIIKDEVDAQTLMLHNLEALTEEDIKNNEDYFSLMEKNIETIGKALQ
jgi:zinc transport system substrate-binding protein